MEKKQVGRIAFRREGKFWVAYYALNETMEDAIVLGSVAMALIEDDEDAKDAFICLIRGTVGKILSHAGPISWDAPIKAPEHERSGHS